MGTYRISRGDGWFTDDYTIQVGFGEKLSKFIRDIGYLRKFYYSSIFEDFLKNILLLKKQQVHMILVLVLVQSFLIPTRMLMFMMNMFNLTLN